MVLPRSTWDEVWGRRLRRHALLEPAPRDRLLDVVGGVCGIHAQMLPSAEISLGLRVAGLTRSALAEELWQRRGLVKTYGLRGTVHLFPAAELRLWLAALRAKPPPRQARPPEQTLTAAERDEVVGAIAEALDGRQLTRDELERAVADRLGGWALEPGPPAFGGSWPRWTLGIGAAAADGVLCFGPNRGNRVTYVRLDQWVPGWAGRGDPFRGGDKALAEVLRRFLAAYGPATPKEFARWFAMDERAAADLFRSLGDEVEEVDVDGWRGWQPAGDPPGPPAGEDVRLLPHFDCYVVGAHPRDRFMHPQWAARGLTAGTAATLPALLVGGVHGGLWHRVRRGRKVEITVEPFGRLGAAGRRRIEAEADRIGAILECSVSVEFGAVPARPHL
jgi:Winged helix DNA-binding domain